jgi:Holliday junction DNA helicase RuvA
LAILTVCPPERLGLIMAAQDTVAIRQADGVGPKLATRIVTELKDKAAKIDIGGSFTVQNAPATVGKKASSSAGQGQNSAAADNITGGVNNDAISALINLGYSRSDAYTAVMNASAQANDNDRDNLQVILRLALKALSG